MPNGRPRRMGQFEVGAHTFNAAISVREKRGEWVKAGAVVQRLPLPPALRSTTAQGGAKSAMRSSKSEVGAPQV